MALTPCQPCSCIDGNIPNDKFKQDIEVILCAILAAAGGTPAPFTNNWNYFEQAVPASVPAAFTVALAVTDGYKWIRVLNDLNAAIELSFDGGTLRQFKINAGENLDIPLFANRLAPLSVFYRYATGEPAPTLGKIEIIGGY